MPIHLLPIYLRVCPPQPVRVPQPSGESNPMKRWVAFMETVLKNHGVAKFTPNTTTFNPL